MAQFSDDLNRANAGTLGGDYSPASGQSSHALVSNTAQQPSLGSPAAADYSNLVTAITPGADQFAAIDIDAMAATGYSNGGAYVRGDTAGLQGYTFGIGADGVTFLYDWIGDTFLATGAHSLAGGERFTTVIRGPAINGFIDGVLEISATNTSTASGRAGISSFGLDGISPGDVVFDDLHVGDLPIQVAGVGAEASAANGGLTLNAPSSPASGDLWLAVIHVSDQAAISMSGDWTEVVQGNGGGSTSRLAAFQHRYAGSTPDLTVTHTGGQSPIGGIMAFRATESGQQVSIDVAGSVGGGTDGSIEHGSITPTVDLGLLLLINGAADDNARTVPAGYLAGFEDTAGGTQNAYTTTAGTPDGSVSVIYRDSMAAATGIIAITQAASDPWAAVQIALKAEAAAATPVVSDVDPAAFGSGQMGIVVTGSNF